MPLLDDLDKRREISARHRENSGRLAQSFGEFESDGAGTFEHDERIGFGLLFVERPSPAHCCSIDMDELEDVWPYAGAPVIPQVTGYVTEWDQDDRGFYTGCWVAARVDFAITAMVDPSISVAITHHFTFNGVGLKDVSSDQTA